MINVVIGLGLVVVFGFVVWVLWVYHHSGRLKDISGIISAIAMVASLPLGAKLISERTSIVSQAEEIPRVIQVQTQTVSGDTMVVYVTLSDAAYIYMELPELKYNKQVIMSQGKVDPRIGHSFLVSIPKGEKVIARLYVNGRLDEKQVEIK